MPPYLLLAALIGAIYGALFYIWRGKRLTDLPIYLLTGMIGFVLGQALADLTQLNVAKIGPIHALEATIICWGTLFLVYWLKIK